VLTHGAWQRLLAADPAVLERDVRVDGIARRVIGVLPPGFVGPAGDADFYFAFDLRPVLADPVAARRSQWLGLVGRLKPGVTPGSAAQEVTRIWSDLVREYPGDNGSLGIAALPLRDAMVGETRTPLIVLMASAALVLLIACANLAATLLSRALARRKEFAVRVALGAGRRRIVRQLLTESLLLAAIGGAAGLLLATLALTAVGALALPVLPAYADLSLDRGAVLVTAVLALCTGLLFGLAPAVAAGHRDSQGALGDESRGSTESRRSQRVRGLLMAGQMALCVSLLAGAGLLARSLWAMAAQPLGFEPHAVLSAMVQLPSRSHPTLETRVRFHEQFVERLGALPGVEAVASATSIPTAVNSRTSLSIVGRGVPGEAQPFVLSSFVSDDYFRTLRIPLRAGRTFGREDRVGAPRTVVVSEALARQFWPGGGAVGARIRLGPNPSDPPIEVIGVVADVRNDSARRDAEPMIYGAIHQAAPPFVSVLVRATGDPLALVSSIEGVLTSLGGGLALQRPMTLTDVVGQGLAGRRLPVLLMAAFGALALILASVGVYAMFASMTAAREREFGVRMALGSRPRAIAALVLRQGAGWMATGLVGGAVGIVIAVRLVRGLLYAVSPFDPITLAVSVGALVACATLALLVPLVRATRTDPAIALRAQ
jgi:putative ABC transport system permease protein